MPRRPLSLVGWAAVGTPCHQVPTDTHSMSTQWMDTPTPTKPRVNNRLCPPKCSYAAPHSLAGMEVCVCVCVCVCLCVLVGDGASAHSIVQIEFTGQKFVVSFCHLLC
uniref:Uncharacterized protein n=1 Tax=Eutreptiella gymnastica TaxID=73025 RepID=A0A7S4G4P2_9EUGL